MSTAQPASPTRDTASAMHGASSPRAAIEAANARVMSAFRAGDAAALAACYTPDAQLLPANSEAVSGSDAIQRFWSGAIAAGIADARLETAEVEAQGPLAVEVGRYTLAGADGGTLDQGKYVVAWHRDDAGAWRLHRDIWTTNRPAPGT